MGVRVFAACFFCLAVLAYSSQAAAHDFWMEADPWTVAPGGTIAPELHVGHVADHAAWSGAPERIVSFRIISKSEEADIRDQLAFDAKARRWSGAVALKAPGVHVLALETNDAFSVLPAEKFQAYLAEEGLTPALRARGASKTTTAPGRERYSRRAKTLVFVAGGDLEAAPPIIGQTLEIAPLDSPFALKPDEPLRLRVLYEGKPLVGATVKLESLSAGLLPVHRAVTDGSGTVSFPLPKRGAWKVSAVWTKPVSGDPNADFATIFASLAFGY